MKASIYQEAIYDFVKGSTDNGIIEAVAGSGKTTTIVEALQFAKGKVLFLAFNKHIVEELKTKVPMFVDVATLNSLGWRACMGRGYIKLDADKTRKILQFSVLKWPENKIIFFKVLGAVCRLVSLLKAHGQVSTTLAEELAIKHGIDIPELSNGQFWDILDKVYKESLASFKYYDFDDQLLQPVIRNYPLPKYDTVFVDEAQDLNFIQMELISRLGARIVAVGDRHQAIYGFRGANPDSMDNIRDRFKATELPLSICYRCAKNIVLLAKEIVPQIEASEYAPDGIVNTISKKDFAPVVGEYILCRVTAPLVTECLKLIRKGVSAIVKGRDLGQGLIDLIEDTCTPSDSVVALMSKLKQKMLKMIEQEKYTIDLEDKITTLNAIGETCATVSDMINRINTIFSDTEKGIVFCTIHRAKGLEADKVYILEPHLLPHPKAKLPWQQKQEENLKYVAITRAKKELVWIE
jgi:DNA helicase-2/ATP-dependent DNA helicase PcrA